MSARGATVAFEAAQKRYAAGSAREHLAVEALSFTVPAGAICALVGPSGCGKTTTLKMGNRLIEPSGGRITIDGVDVAAEDPVELRRRIGYVIQHVGLFPHHTVAENVATVPRLLGWPAARIRDRVHEMLTLTGLDPERLGGRYPAQLSGGERQRVGVARALAAEPPVLLMDEPFGAVVPIVRERLQDEFIRLHQTQSTTVLFVTHDIDEAIKLGDVVAVMREGRLVQFATPDALLAAPADDLVARFVGSDRALKRLSLLTVGGQPLGEAPLAREGDAVTGTGYVLLMEVGGRPIGWVNTTRLAPGARLMRSHADPSSPFFLRETRLRDALSQLLRESLVMLRATRDVSALILLLADLAELAKVRGDRDRSRCLRGALARHGRETGVGLGAHELVATRSSARQTSTRRSAPCTTKALSWISKQRSTTRSSAEVTRGGRRS